jgi:ubiquinone/menaquinone biosynthesis C-methylase UbiE
MLEKLSHLLSQAKLVNGPDGIYSGILGDETDTQGVELELRKRVAAAHYDDYLGELAKSHSIPVMDHEVDRFLATMPENALVLDVGGCWGWHWRRIADTRPDVGVLIIDFVRANLLHAQRVLGSMVGKQVVLVHADALLLPFVDADKTATPFDGVWTVQVFQHISNYKIACQEACRVLKSGGYFVSYSLHTTPLNRAIYRLFRREFHMDGLVDGMYYLTRANDSQRATVAKVFGSKVVDRFTECLFHPDLKLGFTGRRNSTLGRIDAWFGECPWLGRWIARQRSYQVIKT